MNQDHPFHPQKRVLSFKYAFEGITSAIKEEPNIKIHSAIALLVIFAGVYFQIEQLEWIIVFILIGFVISIEMTNTAIEAVVDSLTDKEHPGAKLAKDISAGAVLIAAVTSSIIGIIIFLPYILYTSR